MVPHRVLRLLQPNQHIEEFPTKQIKRVRLIKRADGSMPVPVQQSGT